MQHNKTDKQQKSQKVIILFSIVTGEMFKHKMKPRVDSVLPILSHSAQVLPLIPCQGTHLYMTANNARCFNDHLILMETRKGSSWAPHVPGKEIPSGQLAEASAPSTQASLHTGM